jgi:AcrR family transcriptional regulator
VIDMRADARRNRERIVAVADEVFAAQGADASLDDIAKRAGVGPGTLYRHFPSREALQETVYRDAITELCARGDTLAGSGLEGVIGWLDLLIDHMIARRDLAEALAVSLGKGSEVFAHCHQSLFTTGARVVDPACEQGAVRADLQHRDLLWLANGVAQAIAGAGGADRVERLRAIVRAGLLPR